MVGMSLILCDFYAAKGRSLQSIGFAVFMQMVVKEQPMARNPNKSQ